MDFARKQLEKYGWTDGKGLGKHENGISEALKPKIKRSVTGVGHDPAAEFNEHWWTALYDKAAGNVEVQEKNGKTEKIKTKDDNVVITTSTWKMNNKKKEDGTEQYSEHFVRTAILTNGGSKVENVKSTDSESEDKDDDKKDVFNMTDEELFAACEGRTAHKGARHGLKATGKLARIAQQEALLLKQSRFKGYSHAKKIQEIVVEVMNLDSENEINYHKIKKKKHKRCYSNEKNVDIVNKDVAESERPLPDSNEDCEMTVDSSVASETKNERKSRKSKKKRQFEETEVESSVQKKKRTKNVEVSEMENNSNCDLIASEISLKKKKKKSKES